ncbi:3623_t:CDS:2, partial [Scutellospora calospora]
MSIRYEQEINGSAPYNTRSIKTNASGRVIKNKQVKHVKSEADPYPNPSASKSTSTRACPKCKESSNCINMLNKEFRKIEDLADSLEKTYKGIEARNKWFKTVENYSVMSLEDIQRQVEIR